MIIAGLQKLTTLDYPGKVACTIFTKGCGLHCPFCHNASLVNIEYSNDFITMHEFYSFLYSRINIIRGTYKTSYPVINNFLNNGR